jgi:hypothetical protein
MTLKTQTSRRQNAKRPKFLDLEIRIPVKPKFVAGTAPRQPAISLLPGFDDSSAFIVDKLIHPLPGSTYDAEVTRKICYIVGWHDLPAARILVKCSEALDYLSPLEIENWEYKDALRREEEEWERAIEEAKLVSLGKSVDLVQEPRKRRGRPPKSRLPAQRTPTPAPEVREKALSRKHSGPSLATPSKRSLASFLLEEQQEEDFEDSDDAVARQLFLGYGANTDVDTLDVEVIEEMEHEGGMLDLIPGLSYIPMGSSKQAIPKSDRGSSADPLSQISSIPPVPESNYASSDAPFSSPDRRSQSPIRPARVPVLAKSATKRKREQQSSVRQSSPPKHASNIHGSRTISPQENDPANSLSELPPLKASKLRNGTAPGSSRSRTGTPVSNSYSRPGVLDGDSRTSPPRANISRNTPNQSRSVQKERHPVLSATLTERPLQPRSTKQILTPAPSAPIERFSKKNIEKEVQKAEKADAPANEEDQAWEVKRLEGDRFIEEEDGTIIRYFKVRWEGDWPPDQNPSWEPEENISKGAIKRYLKRKETRAINSSTPRKPEKVQKTLSSWASRRYSSVAEAFEGSDDDLQVTPHIDLGQQASDSVQDAREENLMVVDLDHTPRTLGPLRARESFDVDLARHFGPQTRAGS